jgi:hypothetical protein
LGKGTWGPRLLGPPIEIHLDLGDLRPPTVYRGPKKGDPEIVWDFTHPAGSNGAPRAWDVLRNEACKEIPIYAISPTFSNVIAR